MTDAPLLAHSATRLEGASDRVVICASHGGRYAAALALASGVRAILFNDAGVGRDGAGIAGLGLAQDKGLAAAALDHRSCRIGNAESAAREGVVSHANALALALGVAPSMPAMEAAARLVAARAPAPEPFSAAEHREERRVGPLRLIIIDSASLARPGEDDDALVVTGSHGGLVGDDPKTALKASPRLAAFNDAGVGFERAGLSRLPVLEGRGVAAVTVAADSAVIGEGLSTYRDGSISHANPIAEALGATAGLALAAFIERLANRAPG